MKGPHFSSHPTLEPSAFTSRGHSVSQAIIQRTFIAEFGLIWNFLGKTVRSLETITQVFLALRTGARHAPSQSISQLLSLNVIHSLIGEKTIC